jgi:hypothetical protein
MNTDRIADILSLIIPYFFFALWVLVPIAITWGIVVLVKKNRNKK